MSLLFPKIPNELSGLTYAVAGIVAALVLIMASLSRSTKLEGFPTAGSNGLFGSLGATFSFLMDGAGVIQEGYEKHKSAPFKIADIYRWVVILNSREHLEEIRRAPDDVLSLWAAMADKLNTRYTLGDPEVHGTPYIFTVIRSQITRNIGTKYPEIRDEIITAFKDILDLQGNEWKSISAFSAAKQVTCRTANRVFVGLPLCRNADWIDLNIQHPVNIFKTGFIIGLFPGFMRPMVSRFFTAVGRDIVRGLKHVGPMIEERLEHLRVYGDEWTEKPNDLISWLIEEAEGSRLTVKSLATDLLVVNFTTLHTTAMSMTHALFYLAANPQYIQPLRQEVEGIVKEEGWSKAALGKMRKVDSFMRECQRLEGVSSLSIVRKALKDFTLSDGTFIPEGTVISFPAQSLHRDEKFYENAGAFEPFRFADMQEEDEAGARHQYVSTGIDYLPFGYGKHACPGRFFAATLLKSILAHVVMTYDIKLEDGATRPPSWRFADGISPDPFAKILFRRKID